MAFWYPLGLYSRSCYNCIFFLKEERSTFQCLFPAFQRHPLLHEWHFGGTTVNPEPGLVPTWEGSRSMVLLLPALRLRCFLGSSGSEAVPGALVWRVQETFPGPPLLCPGLVRPFHLVSPTFPAPGGSRYPLTHPKDGESFIPPIVGSGRSGCFCDLLRFWGAGWGGTPCAPAFLLVGLPQPGQPWGPASGRVDPR